MKTFTLKEGTKVKFNNLSYTVKEAKRFPVWGCDLSLNDKNELFWRGYGRAKIRPNCITFEEIPDLSKNFTKEQFKEYALKYGIECAQEFLSCADIVKPSHAYRMINGTKNEENWENPEIQGWFVSIFKKDLMSFIDGYSMALGNAYTIDIIKFEKHLAYEFDYPMHDNISINDFIIKTFGKDVCDKFKKYFLP